MTQSGTTTRRRRSTLPPTISAAEFDRILAKCSRTAPTGVRNAAAFDVMFSCGLRIAEACALAPDDIADSAEGPELTVRNGKGGKGRKNLYVPARTFHLIERWRAVRPSSPCLFCTLDGGQLSPRYLRAALARKSERAGVFLQGDDGPKPVNPHALRHSYASRLVEDVPLNIVQQALGHSNVATTSVYLHANDRRMREALRDAQDGAPQVPEPAPVAVDGAELQALVAQQVQAQLAAILPMLVEAVRGAARG